MVISKCRGIIIVPVCLVFLFPGYQCVWYVRPGQQYSYAPGIRSMPKAYIVFICPFVCPSVRPSGCDSIIKFHPSVCPPICPSRCDSITKFYFEVF